MTLFEGWKLTAGNWAQSAPGPGMHPFRLLYSMGFVAKKIRPAEGSFRRRPRFRGRSQRRGIPRRILEL